MQSERSNALSSLNYQTIYEAQSAPELNQSDFIRGVLCSGYVFFPVKTNGPQCMLVVLEDDSCRSDIGEIKQQVGIVSAM